MKNNQFDHLPTLLLNKLNEARAKNSSYSMRAFARRLGISSGALTEVMNGRRQPTEKVVQRIAENLMLDPEERSKLLTEMAKPQPSRKLRTEYMKLHQDQFQLICEWYHYGLLNLIETADFKNDFEWIAKRLGITKTLAIQATSRLQRLGLLSESKTGMLRRVKMKARTSDDRPSVAIKRSHLESLELAKESLLRDPVDKRDITSMTFSVDPSKMIKAKELIRKFQDDLFEVLSTDQNSEVYKLNVQLFPLTKDLKNEK